eukprot:jgi/Tetstr1/420356/TSEL_011476.t1
MKDFSVPVDSKAVEAAINKNTILVVASSPGYPHGVMDDIQGITKVAFKHRVLCHVDCCLGAFVLPFARMLGHHVPPFDFRLPGVTSMSADTHKVARSRSGALIATAWTSLAFMGLDGFLQVTKKILAISKDFQVGLQKIDGLEVLGQPAMSVVAFKSTVKNLDIYKLNDLLSEKGWHLCALHLPPALHMCFTAAHTMETVQELLADIESCRHQLLTTSCGGGAGSAKLYGMAASLPDRKLVGEILDAYQDIQLEIY